MSGPGGLARAALAVSLLALVGLGCGGPSPGASGLEDLRSVSDLEARFKESSGTPRLVLLLSPT